MELQPDYGFTICQKAETSSHIFIIVVAEKKRFSKQRTIDKGQGTIKELFSTLNTITRLKKCTIFATTIVVLFQNFEMVVKDCFDVTFTLYPVFHFYNFSYLFKRSDP